MSHSSLANTAVRESFRSRNVTPSSTRVAENRAASLVVARHEIVTLRQLTAELAAA
jgi:hypothetical protein